MMMRRRWLILAQYYPPEVGATQITVSTLARELIRQGQDVEVLTALPNFPGGKIFAGYEGRLWMRELIDEVPVRRTWIHPATGRSSIARMFGFLSFTLTALVGALLVRRPDVLLVHAEPTSLGLVALALRLLRGVPYVYNVSDLSIEAGEDLGFIKSRSFLRAAYGLESVSMRNAWKVSTVSDCFRQALTARGAPASRVVILPHCVDAEFLRPQPPDSTLIDRFSLRGKRVFLYAGTMAFYHVLDTVIDAATLLRERKDLVFLFLGDGPERRRLMELTAARKLENVVFGGPFSYAQNPAVHSIAWATVATLRDSVVFRKFRLHKMFTSMSCAVPVIYSGEGDGAELIRRHGGGLTVAPERPDLLADAVMKLDSDPTLRQRLGDEGRRLIEKEFSWPQLVERWLVELELPQVA